MYQGKTGKWILSMRIDSAERFHSCTAIPNFAQKTSCIATTGAEAFKIAHAHWMCLCLCIVNKLHCCVILPGNNEGEMNIWISYYWNHAQNKEMKIIAFKDATYAVAKTMQKIVLGFQTQRILIRNQYNYVIMTSPQLACQLSKWLEHCTGIPRSVF